jgi:hypothetical protein
MGGPRVSEGVNYRYTVITHELHIFPGEPFIAHN